MIKGPSLTGDHPRWLPSSFFRHRRGVAGWVVAALREGLLQGDSGRHRHNWRWRRAAGSLLLGEELILDERCPAMQQPDAVAKVELVN